MVQLPLAGHSLVIEVLRSHSDTPYAVGLLWTSDRLVVETSTWQHTTLNETDIHAPGRIRTHNSSTLAAADPRLRLRGYWDRLWRSYPSIIKYKWPWWRNRIPERRLVRKHQPAAVCTYCTSTVQSQRLMKCTPIWTKRVGWFHMKTEQTKD